MCSILQNVFCGTEYVLPYYSECDRRRSLDRMCSILQSVLNRMCTVAQNGTECVLVCVQQNVFCGTERVLDYHRVCDRSRSNFTYRTQHAECVLVCVLE